MYFKKISKSRMKFQLEVLKIDLISLKLGTPKLIFYADVNYSPIPLISTQGRIRLNT